MKQFYRTRTIQGGLLVLILLCASQNLFAQQPAFPGDGIPVAHSLNAVGALEASNIIIDHCSISWSSDEALFIYRGDSLLRFNRIIW